MTFDPKEWTTLSDRQNKNRKKQNRKKHTLEFAHLPIWCGTLVMSSSSPAGTILSGKNDGKTIQSSVTVNKSELSNALLDTLKQTNITAGKCYILIHISVWNLKLLL